MGNIYKITKVCAFVVFYHRYSLRIRDLLGMYADLHYHKLGHGQQNRGAGAIAPQTVGTVPKWQITLHDLHLMHLYKLTSFIFTHYVQCCSLSSASQILELRDIYCSHCGCPSHYANDCMIKCHGYKDRPHYIAF